MIEECDDMIVADSQTFGSFPVSSNTMSYEQLKKDVEWVITDMSFKAPEQYKSLVPFWMEHLKKALGM